MRYHALFDGVAMTSREQNNNYLRSGIAENTTTRSNRALYLRKDNESSHELYFLYAFGFVT